MNFTQYEIYMFECCNEGRPLAGRQIPPHYFLILSGTEYNGGSQYLTAIPLTSERRPYWIAEITVEDMESFDGSSTFLSKATFALCDRPCRILKTDIRNPRAYRTAGKLKRTRSYEIIEQITKFLKSA
jgi:hypothetical protein